MTPARGVGPGDLAALMRVIERLDELAETAELMDDHGGADRFRVVAARARAQAMRTLDD